MHDNLFCALCLSVKWGFFFFSRSKYIPRLACPGLISADSEETLPTKHLIDNAPGVTSVHVQYMCRRLCVGNGFLQLSPVLGVATQTLQTVVNCCQQERNMNHKRGSGDKHQLINPNKKQLY